MAEWQNIVYNEYLPVILGPATMARYNLAVTEHTQYNSWTDPSLINSFATAAYR